MNFSIRWDDATGVFDWWLQGSVLSASSSWSSLVAEQRQKQQGYQVANLQLGVNLESWQLLLAIENLTDERATLFINDQDDVARITTNRPRTVGVNVRYQF